MEQYPWLMPAYQQLISPLLRQRAHHAWLISYVIGSGEVELIQAFIAALLCLSGKEKSCGSCHSCLLYQAGNHPDFYHITVEKDKRFIGIDQIRKMIDKIYEHAQQGGVKAVWIENAALMSEGASNALLKILEEPPADTYFILSEEQPKQIIPTIRSRCYAFYLPSPDLESGICWLQGKYQHYHVHQFATALLLNKNAPLAAEKLLRSDHWAERQQFCQLVNETAAQGQFWPMLSHLNTGNLLKQNGWFCSLLLDAIKAKNRVGRYITNRDQVALIRVLARYDTKIINDWYVLWQTVAEQIKFIPGLNEQLILANLLAQSEIVVMSAVR